MAINEEKMNQLFGRFLDDFGAVFHGAMVVIGDKLGLYKAIADGGPLTPGEARLREVVTSGGFTRFRRATETPFNLVFEARP